VKSVCCDHEEAEQLVAEWECEFCERDDFIFNSSIEVEELWISVAGIE